MGSIPLAMLVHTVSVEPHLGVNADGPVYDTAVAYACLIEDVNRLVRTADGREVVASVDLYLAPGTVIPLDSRITVRGRAATAVAVMVRDGGGLATPDHVQVTCE